MIALRQAQDERAFFEHLKAKAAALAAAYAETRLRERRADPSRWRRAALLWPLMTKD